MNGFSGKVTNIVSESLLNEDCKFVSRIDVADSCSCSVVSCGDALDSVSAFLVAAILITVNFFGSLNSILSYFRHTYSAKLLQVPQVRLKTQAQAKISTH